MSDRALTEKIDLPGGQLRVKQLILYVSKSCEGAKFFGAIKLNKIIWRADFRSYADRKIPITGRAYRRQKLGPVLREMLPIHRDMLMNGSIIVERRDFGDGIFEHRTVAVDVPRTNWFSKIDLEYIDESISHYWEMTGEETSDESHGVAWKTRSNGDAMPYELALLSDEPLDRPHFLRVEQMIYDKGWVSE